MTYNRKYSNDEITVYWQPDLCIHAGVCITELPRVFNSRRRPWVDLSQGDTGSIIETINSCPTNALMYSWNDPVRNSNDPSDKVMRTKKVEERFEEKSTNKGSAAAKVKLQVDGPIIITGSYELENEFGETVTQSTPCSICRCGKSRNMPFCDGSHAASEK